MIVTDKSSVELFLLSIDNGQRYSSLKKALTLFIPFSMVSGAIENEKRK